MSVVVVVPSRGRPQNAEALMDAWWETRAAARVCFAVDTDDPTRGGYIGPASDQHLCLTPLGTSCMGQALAAAVEGVMGGRHGVTDPPEIVGFMGDDHRPRTVGWDQRISEAMAELGGTGIVYGNDLVHGPGLPTAVFVSTDIIAALGYMAPPVLQHMFLDNYWKALGEGAGCLTYLPDVVIEHVHPLVGKAEPDEHYERAAALMGPDADAYAAFVADGGLERDIAKVRALRSVAV